MVAPTFKDSTLNLVSLAENVHNCGLMKKAICLLTLTASFLTNQLHAEFRSWTNSEGVSLDAEFVKVEGDNVTLRLRSGKLSTFPQTKLSSADQEFIKSGKDTRPAATPTEVKPSVPADRKAKWLTKMEKAQEQSKETGLPILVLFTGTSWCPYCIKLEKEVFSESAFKTFADKNLVLLMLDFGPGGTPNSKKDGQLAKDFGVDGYPNYFLTYANGKQFADGGYHEGINPDAFAKWVTDATPKK